MHSEWPRYPGGSDGKESACQHRRSKFDPWVGEIPRRRNGNLVQYSCPGNPMEPCGLQSMVSESRTWLSNQEQQANKMKGFNLQIKKKEGCLSEDRRMTEWWGGVVFSVSRGPRITFERWKLFWRWMVVMVTQKWNWTQCHWTAYLKQF